MLALVLLVPAPSLGVLAAMVFFPNTAIGALCFAASKLWLFGLPIVWRLVVDREPLSLSPPRHGGFGVAHFRFPGFGLAAASAAYLMRVIRSAQCVA